MYLILILVYAQLFGCINTYGYPGVQGNQGEGPGDEASEIREREQYLQNLKKSDTKPKSKHSKGTKSKEHSTEKTEKSSVHEDLSKTQNSTEKSSVLEFECPWACYWQCHSYCPSQCCHNPLKCDWECKEYCGSRCSEVCCAPGVQRMAPYQPELSSQKDEITNASTIIKTAGAPAPAAPPLTAVPAPPSAAAIAPVAAPAPAPAASTSPVAAAPASPPAPAPKSSKSRSSKKMSKTAGTVKQTAAESAIEQEKEQQDDIAFISQLEALRQATHYAADLMGLPPDCPDACVQICLPGFCAPHCCAKSIIPQNFMSMYNNKNSNNNNNNHNINNEPPLNNDAASTALSTARQNTPVTSPAITAPATQRYNPPGYPLRKMSTAEIVNAQRKRLLAMQQKARRRAALRKMAYLRRMRGQALAPLTARYNKMALYNRRKALMRKSAQARAAQQYASAYCKYSKRCGVPYTRNITPVATPPALPMRTCNSICRSICIPQCPNECCSRIKKKTVVPHEINEDCPWGCFWKCQSYCPSKCCNNPNKCDISCREICAPHCASKCCAPGSKRLPKLKINFMIDTNDNSSAESSYQLEKEQSEKINIVNKIDALKKTTIYAAKLMGLPSECPLACARICLPGLCRHDCCGKAHTIGPPLSCPISCSEACYPGLCTGQCCTRPPPPLNTNGVPQMPYLNFDRDYRPKPFIWNSNPYIRTINEDLMTEKLRKGKIILPDTDQYKALMLISSLSKKQLKTLLKKSGIAEKKLAKRSVIVS